MKRFVMLVMVFLMSVVAPMFPSDMKDEILTGWRQNPVISQCEEFDIMVDNGSYWVVRWGSSRDVIKSALIRDGFVVTETDSTMKWRQTAIYDCELQFNNKQKLIRVGYNITVPISYGYNISTSLKRKMDMIYRTTGKPKMVGSSLTYSWLDNDCGSRSIYTMMASTVIEGNSYMINVLSSPIGE